MPAILVINLQITTFFFVAGLMLLERDEGMLNAFAVSPLSPSGYLAMRTVSLTGLAAAETIAVVWIGFGPSGSWSLILGGTAAIGVIYTGFGAAVATRYDSVNALLLPASAFVALLLLPAPCGCCHRAASCRGLRNGSSTTGSGWQPGSGWEEESTRTSDHRVQDWHVVW